MNNRISALAAIVLAAATLAAQPALAQGFAAVVTPPRFEITDCYDMACGQVGTQLVLCVDDNHDPLTLEVLELGGLELVEFITAPPSEELCGSHSSGPIASM